MKKRILVPLLALMFCFCVTSAHAFWVGDVTAPVEGVTASNVMGFDWSSSGSAMASPTTAGSLVALGDEFTLNFQSELVGLTDPDGNPVAFNGLTTDFEFTLVAKIPERVVISELGGLFAAFMTLPGSSFYLYYDDVPNSDVATGFGFDDGVLVASGSFGAGQISSFLATSPTQGIGSFSLIGLVDYVDALYLDPAIDIFGFRAEGTLNLPPLDSSTASFFDGTAGEGNYDALLIGDNILFKADASSKFNVVPEPSTILLLGAGLLGLAFTVRRRNKI